VVTGSVQRGGIARQRVSIGVRFGFDDCFFLCCALSSGAASDVFGVHGDEVVYDDSAHGKSTESVGEGV
jgi:hypothetical protein